MTVTHSPSLPETETVIDMASDGRGIVRHDNLVTFIPFTAQGDHIQYQITERKKNYSSGSLLQVLKPSPERITPLCPYFGTCGGCQLQHIQYTKQLEHKRKWVENALRKIGKLPDISISPVTPAHPQWNYRRHINLVLRKHQNHFQAGYIATDNKSLITIKSCPIFADANDPVLEAIQLISEQLNSSEAHDGKVTLLKSHLGYIAHFHFKTMPTNISEVLSKNFEAFSFLSGLLATSQKESFQWGTIDTSCIINDVSFDFSTKTFIQNHPEQSLNIYKKIIQLTADLKPVRVLDLYCGIGISSLLLAQQGSHVMGVELNRESIKFAESNVRKNQVKNARFMAANVENVLENLLKNEKPDLILVNPPREGLSPKVTQLLESCSASHIIYVSCMPSTLARDLHLICQKNYRIDFLQSFDMFPQTVHVETLVVLSKISNTHGTNV